MDIRKPIITVLAVLSVSVIYLQSNQGILPERSITLESNPVESKQVDARETVRIKVAESTECNPRVTVCDEK